MPYLIIILFVFSTPLFCNAQADEKYLDDLLTTYYNQSDNRKVYLQTDKYLYVAGENIWLSGLVVDRHTNRKVIGENVVHVYLENKNDNFISVSVNVRDGLMKGKIKLPGDFTEGRYRLSARLNNQEATVFQKEVLVKKQALPFFIVNVDLEDKIYPGGSEVSLMVSAKNFDNEPLKSASFAATLFDGTNKVIHKKEKLNKEGVGSIEIKLPDNAKGELTLNLSVDHKGAVENVQIEIPVQSEEVTLNFYPEGKNLVHGVINRMAFKAIDRSGRGFPFSGRVITNDGVEIGTINSDEKGEGILAFKPNASQQLKVIITSPYKINKEFEIPPVNTIGVTLVLTAHEDKDSLEFKVLKHLTRSQRFNMAVLNRGRKVYFQTLKLNADNNFQLHKNIFRPGINQITIFDSLMVPLSEQLYYVSVANNAGVKTLIEKDKYRLRERVDVVMESPANLTLALTAADEYRMITDAAMQNISSYFFIGSEISGDVVYAPEELSSVTLINDRLKYHSSLVRWENIFKANQKDLTYNTFVDVPAVPSYSGPYFLKFEKGRLSYTNYRYSNYYAAINPALQSKKDKPHKPEPPYKEQLRSGMDLRTVLYNIRPYEVLNNSIVFLGQRNSLMAQGGALIVIDGIRAGTNVSTLDNINPFSVDRINVSTQPVDIMNYTALNNVGVVEISTIKGKAPEEQVEEEEFQAPEYDESESRRGIKEKTDLRTTIQWIPFHTVDNFPATIKLYHSDLYTSVRGIVEGIDAEGNVFHTTFTYASR